MYSNNIVNFQESTIILNACTNKSGNLLKAPRSNNLLQMQHFEINRVLLFNNISKSAISNMINFSSKRKPAANCQL